MHSKHDLLYNKITYGKLLQAIKDNLNNINKESEIINK